MISTNLKNTGTNADLTVISGASGSKKPYVRINSC